mgnify:CR=1 FL=1
MGAPRCVEDIGDIVSLDAFRGSWFYAKEHRLGTNSSVMSNAKPQRSVVTSHLSPDDLLLRTKGVG